MDGGAHSFSVVRVLGGGGVVRKECGALTPRCGEGKCEKSRNKPRGNTNVGESSGEMKKARERNKFNATSSPIVSTTTVKV